MRAAAPTAAQGFITVREFRDITGTAVADLTGNAKFPNSPDVTAYPAYFEWPNGGDIYTTPPANGIAGQEHDNYGAQIIGYFYPPATGPYVFYVCADDNAELYLSEDDTPAKKHLIARETSWSNPRQYDTSAGSSDLTAKRSDQFAATAWPQGNTINLTQGRAYYIEALMKEGTGGDNLSVAVQDPTGAIDSTLPIPGAYLSTIDRASVTQPYLKDFVGNFGGVWFYVTEPGDTMNRSTVKLTLNGADVPAAFATVDSTTLCVSYRVPAALAAGSANTASLQFTDSASRSQTITKQFVVAPYATVPASWATTTFSGNGMKVFMTQIDFVDALGNLLAGRFPGDANAPYNAERQIAGDFKKADGTPYPNAANPPNFTVQTVNWEQLGADIDGTPEDGPDHFNSVLPSSRPRPNEAIPNVDPSIATSGSTTAPDNIAAAITTFLELKKGFHRLVVNSDDGFTLRAGPGIGGVIGGALLGSFNTGRGAADTRCEFWVEQDGVYPVRLLYWEGNGGASVEWFAEQPEDFSRILVNDRAVTGAIKAYDTGTARAYTKTVLPYPDQIGVPRKPDYEFEIVDDATAYVSGSFKLSIDGAGVTPSISTTAGKTTVTYSAPSEAAFGSVHTVAFEWVENTTPPTTNAYTYTYTTVTFTPDDLPDASFWIEAEDFDFDGGRHMPEADNAIGTSPSPYLGGAYEGLGALWNVDFNCNGPYNSNNYRTEEAPLPATPEPDHEGDVNGVNADNNLGGQYGSSRPGGVTMSVSYKLGWMGGNVWFNYTRKIPAGTYTAYAALSVDVTDDDALGGNLDKITAGLGQDDANQTKVRLGQFVGKGTGAWGRNELVPLYKSSTDRTPAVFKITGTADTTLRFTSTRGDFDWFVLVPLTGVAPQLKALTDLNHSLPRDATIQWQIEDFSAAVDPATVKLKINGTAVPAAEFAVTKAGELTTATYNPAGLLEGARLNTYEITFRATGAANTFTNTGTFVTNYRPTAPPGSFLIEAEDYNYDGGKTNPKKGQEGLDVDVMPYLGTAYDGLSATAGIDYNRTDAQSDGDMYRLNETPNTPLSNDGDLVRSADSAGNPTWSVTANYRLGWAGGGRWFNYTRQIPAGAYQVWASMSYGDAGADVINGVLSKVTSDPTQPNQTTETIGYFSGSSTGGWGANQLFPLRLADNDRTGAPAVVNLGGASPTTLRFEDASGDLDYFILVPAGGQPPGLEITGVAVAGGNVTLTWTGGGTLQSSTDLKTWSDVTGAVGGTYSAPATDAYRFYRLRQ